MKLNILFNRELVVDVWRSPQGKVCMLGHDIEPRSVIPALGKAAVLMRQQLNDRGESLVDFDTEMEHLSAPGIEPRRVGEILGPVVFGMAERLCPPGQDALDVEIGQASPLN